MHLLVNGGSERRVTGEVLVPNSKYHAHRALILASLADGTSRIRGLSDARHVQYTVRLLRGLGVGVRVEGDTFVVEGLGGTYHPRRSEVSAGSSGTTLYFMLGLAALSDRPVSVTGQKYFRRRPVGPLLAGLRQMGVGVESPDDCPPVLVSAGRPKGGRVRIAGTLSQWISGLILLAPFATGPTVVEVEGVLNERTYLELTVAMMRRFGLEVGVSADWRRFEIEPDQRARPTELTLPPDIGSAAFGIAAAAVHPADVLLRGLDRLTGGPADHPEVHFLELAAGMGVPMELVDLPAGQGRAGERAVRIRHDGTPLKGTDVDCRDVPDMLPVLSAMACFAEGETVFRHVAHTRLKESDRAAAMLQLNAMGGELRLDGDALRVAGVGRRRRLRGAPLSSFNDHRVLMSLAVAASRAEGPSTLTYPNAYRISYPRFLEAMNALGLPMSVESGKRPSGAGGGLEPELLRPGRAAGIGLPEWVARRARSRPDETAVVEVRADRVDRVDHADRADRADRADLAGAEEGRLTWRELAERSDRAAELLRRLGVRPGERVAYQLPNRLEFAVLSLAVLRIGAVCCPIMPIFREREVGDILRRSQARVLVVADGYRGRRPAEEVAGLPADELAGLEQVLVLPSGPGGRPGALPSGGGLIWRHWDEALAEVTVDQRTREELDALRPAPDAPAQLLFTSGTSGRPKGVLHTAGTLSRAAAMEIRHLGLDRSDVVWVPSPLAHQTGFLYGMWLALELGVPMVVQPEWDPAAGLRAVREHRVSFVQAATPFLADLVRAVEEQPDGPESVRSLRIFVATGAAVPRGLAERATRVLGAAVCGAFGTTETCLGALASPADDPALRWGTDGRALDGVRLRITDDEGRELPAGQEGNFELRGPTVFQGYLERPDLTAEAFTKDGWYRTGDLAAVDESGFLRITGRVKDVINRGGEKLPVAEIEQLLHEHPSVAEAAVVAMPDPRLGERACAFVALRPGAGTLTLDQLRTFLDGRRMAKQYWPERLETLDRLPRNAAGKVQKYALRELAAEPAG
ncbi:3-phosphoshikimate 1-carboxyvinyltransferase [Phaeacidiphilus oryzae]|uniref:3-phosphoshikimate 1-carboxyvinyltransferase n=1 Tax=Phaeacidiphilus oryzae TaxID=348818 RepID=UPI00055CFAB8|nr:3-phosphoshikimate 1-carboxyvinyltransferase [Phaeacidiphilus oryzae]